MIHSKSQLKHFGGKVFDSAMSTSDKQMVVTHEGYVIPLHIHNGLFYMGISAATGCDLELYPHVFLTADSPWDPDIIDEDFLYNVDMPLIQNPKCCNTMRRGITASMHMGSSILFIPYFIWPIPCFTTPSCPP